MEPQTDCIQVWYANNSLAFGTFDSLLTWFKSLLLIGPLFGYFPEPTKCQLLVKESMINEALAAFADTGVRVVTSYRFLIGCIGDTEGITNYVLSKVSTWVDHIHQLSEIAKEQPQAAYVALTKSLQHGWFFLQRLAKNSSLLFQKLDEALFSHFIPSLFNHPCTPSERLLFSLPIRNGGLNISVPTLTALTNYASSQLASVLLTESIKRFQVFSLIDHEAIVLSPGVALLYFKA